MFNKKLGKACIYIVFVQNKQKVIQQVNYWALQVNFGQSRASASMLYAKLS